MPAAEAPPAPPPSVDAGGGQPPAASNAAAEGGGAATTTVDTGRSEGTGAESNSAGAQEKAEGGGPTDAEKAAAEAAQANLEASVRAEIVAENEGPEAALHDLADIKAHRPAPVISQAEADQRIQRAGEVREGVAEAPAASDAAPAAATDQEQPAATQPLTEELKRERANTFLKNDRIDPQYYRNLIRDRIRIKMAEKGITLNEKEINSQTETEYYRQKAEAIHYMGQLNEDIRKDRLWKMVTKNIKISNSIREEAQKRGLDENSQEFKDFKELTQLAEYLRLKDKKGPLGLIIKLLALLGYMTIQPMYDQFLEPIGTGRK